MSRPTSIKSIEIKNIRGIKSRLFEFKTPEMFANKIHLLVAPNGFGKSSFTHAFDILKPKSIDQNKLERYEGDDELNPSIKLIYNKGGIPHTLDQHQIKKHFSISVIRSRISPKVKQGNSFVGGKATATNSVEAIRICSIPVKPSITYSKRLIKEQYGENWKVLPNITSYYSKPLLLESLLQTTNDSNLHKLTLWNKIAPLLQSFHQYTGTASEIKSSFENSLINQLKEHSLMTKLVEKINVFFTLSVTDRYLFALNFVEIAKNDKHNLEAHIERCSYEDAKQEVQHLIDSVNSNPNWLSVKLTQSTKKKELVASFPIANHMSSGQRDLFSFICQLIKAKFDLRNKHQGILIIDEVFDYLDECNLLLAQYYIRKFLEDYRSSDKELFPILFTHLDPKLFNHHGLGKKNKINIHLLDNQHGNLHTNSATKLVKARENEPAKKTIGKYFFHYEEESHNASELFQELNLPSDWSDSHNFYKYAEEELEKYKITKDTADLVAACVGIRLNIEKKAYSKLSTDEQKRIFTDECNTGTNSKLDYVSELGMTIPESHRILGLVYNDMLHFKKNFDYISNIISKMKNPAIRTMILMAIDE